MGEYKLISIVLLQCGKTEDLKEQKIFSVIKKFTKTNFIFQILHPKCIENMELYMKKCLKHWEAFASDKNCVK